MNFKQIKLRVLLKILVFISFSSKVEAAGVPIKDRCEHLLRAGIENAKILKSILLREAPSVPFGLEPLPIAKLSQLGPLITHLVKFDQFKFIQEASKLALDKGIVYLPLSTGYGSKGAIVVVEPELVSKVFKNVDKAFVRGADTDLLKQFIGEGLLTTDGEVWAEKRKLFQSFLFSKSQIEKSVEVMRPVIESSLVSLESSARTGVPIDFHEVMKSTTLRVISKVLFDYDISPSEISVVSESLKTALEVTAQQSIWVAAYADSKRPIEDPAFVRSVKAMDAIVYKIISQQYEKYREAPNRSTNFLTVLFDSFDTTNSAGKTKAFLSKSEFKIARDEVMTMLLAGHETTANALTWTWVRLLESPQWIHEMRTSPQRKEYLSWIHKEALRIDAPVYWYSRFVQHDTKIGNYFIPQGTVVFLSPTAVHRHPRYWSDPDIFDPQRFSKDQNDAQKNASAYCPFSGGGHVCIGMPLALAEMNLVSGLIAERFVITKNPFHEIERQGRVTLQPVNGVWVHVNRR